MMQPTIKTDAAFSECRRFRYWLVREWDPKKRKVAFIGLNPSTADETKDDPTIRRCIGFARTWGKGGLLMLNLYAFRATLPADLWKATKRGIDIVGGSRNLTKALQGYFNDHDCDLVVGAWGAHGTTRGMDLIAHWPGICYLALNGDGSPKHPLYLRADLRPTEFGTEK